LAEHITIPPGPNARPLLPRIGEVALSFFAWGSALLVVAAFGWLMADLLSAGAASLDWSFFTEPPLRSGRAGGISTVLVSTLLILAVCLSVAMPLGLGTAILLSEFARGGDRLGHWIRISLDVLAGVPSIVFGLFGNAFFCLFLGMGFSILSGGLTLACMALPILIRSIEVSLRAVPDDYRLAGAALDLSQTRLVFHILLPAAAPGVVAGLLLGIGRALAETAALIFTSGYVDRMPGSLLDSGRALSIHIYDLAMNVPGGEPNAYGSAVVLIVLLLFINVTATWLVGRVLGRARRRAG
jgi:phosphate transport system permease protein